MKSRRPTRETGRRGLTHGPLGGVAAYARDDGLLTLDRGVHDLVGVRGLLRLQRLHALGEHVVVEVVAHPGPELVLRAGARLDTCTLVRRSPGRSGEGDATRGVLARGERPEGRSGRHGEGRHGEGARSSFDQEASRLRAQICVSNSPIFPRGLSICPYEMPARMPLSDGDGDIFFKGSSKGPYYIKRSLL